MLSLKYPQVPVYMAGQYLGAFLAAVVLWGEYANAIKMVSIQFSHCTFQYYLPSAGRGDHISH